MAEDALLAFVQALLGEPIQRVFSIGSPSRFLMWVMKVNSPKIRASNIGHCST